MRKAVSLACLQRGFLLRSHWFAFFVSLEIVFGGDPSHSLRMTCVRFFACASQLLTPSIFRSYSLITFSRTTLRRTSLGRWPSSRAITSRECGQVDAACGLWWDDMEASWANGCVRGRA